MVSSVSGTAPSDEEASRRTEQKMAPRARQTKNPERRKISTSTTQGASRSKASSAISTLSGASHLSDDVSEASWWTPPPTTPVRLPKTNYDEYRFAAIAQGSSCIQNRDAREERIQALIKQYSCLNAVCAEDTHAHARESFDEQSIVEKGEEVTYGEFLTGPEGSLPRGRPSCVPRFHKLFQRSRLKPSSHDEASESEEEPCNYDYYFSPSNHNTPTGSTRLNTTANDEFDTVLHSSPDRSSGILSSSSDGSYSSDDSPSPVDPFLTFGCANQILRRVRQECGSSTQSILLNDNRHSPRSATSSEEDAYCSFFPASASLPSIDEEAGPETTLCNWSDVQYYSHACAAHTNDILQDPPPCTCSQAYAADLRELLLPCESMESPSCRNGTRRSLPKVSDRFDPVFPSIEEQPEVEVVGQFRF